MKKEFTEKQLRYFTRDFDDRRSLPSKGSIERLVLEHNASLGMREIKESNLSNRKRGKLQAQGIIETTNNSDEWEYEWPLADTSVRDIIDIYLPFHRVEYILIVLYLAGEKGIDSTNLSFEESIALISKDLESFKSWYESNESTIIRKTYDWKGYSVSCYNNAIIEYLKQIK